MSKSIPYKIFIILLFLFFISCENNITGSRCSDLDLIIEYQLYGKILDEIHLEDPYTTILINDSTIYLDIQRINNSVKQRFSDIDTTLFSLYDEINQSPEQIKCIPATKHEKVYFSDEYNGSVSDNDVYGLISFSKIAYNDLKNQAILCFMDYGAPLVATASLAYFRYSNNRWDLVGYYLIWIS